MSLSCFRLSTSHTMTILSLSPAEVACMQETACLMSTKSKMPSGLHANGESKRVKRFNLMVRACLKKSLLGRPSFTVPSSIFLHNPSVSGDNSKSVAFSSPSRVTLLERVILLSLNLAHDNLAHNNTQERRLRGFLALATPVSQ